MFCLRQLEPPDRLICRGVGLIWSSSGNLARRMALRLGSQIGSPSISPVVVEGQNTADEEGLEDGTRMIEPQEEEIPAYKAPRVSFDSDNSGDELEKDARNRQRIRPKGNMFQSNEDNAVKVITHNIHAHFDGPWGSFSKVPDYYTNLWWTEFQNHFFWKDRHATKVKAIWRSKCSQHIRNAFCDARKKKRNPPFVSPEHWAIILKDWDKSDKFKRMCETNKLNRASEGRDGLSLYTGGSRSVVQNVDKIEKESGRRMTQEEVVVAMYHSKKKGKFTGDRPQKCIDYFNALCGEWREAHPGEEMPQEQINKLWLEASGGDEKGRIYGQGSLYRKVDNVLNPAAKAPPSPSPAPPSPAHDPLPRALSPPANVATTPSLAELAKVAQQQQEVINQLLHQLNQERMHASRSNVLPSTMQTMSFRSLLNSTGPSVYGDGPTEMTELFGDLYGDDTRRPK